MGRFCTNKDFVRIVLPKVQKLAQKMTPDMFVSIKKNYSRAHFAKFSVWIKMFGGILVPVGFAERDGCGSNSDNSALF